MAGKPVSLWRSLNPPLTIRPAKSADLFGVLTATGAAPRPWNPRDEPRGSSRGHHRSAAVFDAANPDAMASGAPAPAGPERRQCRHPELPAAGPRTASVRAVEGRDDGS